VAPPPIDPEHADGKEDCASPLLDDQRWGLCNCLPWSWIWTMVTNCSQCWFLLACRLDQAMDDASKQDLQERLRRTEFVKQMLMTTIAQDWFSRVDFRL
jgi:hypothetical protein